MQPRSASCTEALATGLPQQLSDGGDGRGSRGDSVPHRPVDRPSQTPIGPWSGAGGPGSGQTPGRHPVAQEPVVQPSPTAGFPEDSSVRACGICTGSIRTSSGYTRPPTAGRKGGWYVCLSQ